MWNGEKPNLKPLKISSCRAYAKEMGQLKKRDKQSRCYKFMGYARNTYRLWDPEKGKIKISRDVVFDETPETKKISKRAIQITDDKEQEDGKEKDEQETERRREKNGRRTRGFRTRRGFGTGNAKHSTTRDD